MKPRIKEVIVVEGRYDRNALAQVVDATVVETGGFPYSTIGKSWLFCGGWRKNGGLSC